MRSPRVAAPEPCGSVQSWRLASLEAPHVHHGPGLLRFLLLLPRSLRCLRKQLVQLPGLQADARLPELPHLLLQGASGLEAEVLGGRAARTLGAIRRRELRRLRTAAKS